MKRISLIRAGAGTGKTTKLTDIVQEAFTKGTCRPGGLIATTFTVKAAEEITDRIRTRLFQAGLHTQAERLGESMIGTVHSVCARVLERFAFDAGISPQLQIMPEADAGLLLQRAIDQTCTHSELDRVQRLADQLEDKDGFTYRWRSTVEDIIEQARANDVANVELPKMAEWSLQQLFAFLPPLESKNLDNQLSVALADAISRIESGGDTTRKTATALELLKDAQKRMGRGNLPWNTWVKLSKLDPAKGSRNLCNAVVEITSSFERHPRFRSEITEYTELLFDLARRTLACYETLKGERGLMDFTDLEHRTYHLLRDEAVRRIVTQELDLLLVDEFQDTSPLQLALFLRLADCASQSVWVGDVKQAIYGFRGTDPSLISAVAAELKTESAMPNILDTSYRSVPDLVNLTNHVFAPAFAESLSLTSNEVVLKPSRSGGPKHAVEFFVLRSGVMNQNGTDKRMTNAQIFPTIAEGVRQLLDGAAGYEVYDSAVQAPRRVQAGDVAILCRTNDNAAAMADALANLGLTVSIGGPGLFATPECRLVMSCLRRLADPTDTLATAAVIAMTSGKPIEELIANRIDYVNVVRGTERPDRWGLEEPLVSSAIVELEKVRTRLSFLSPSEALDQALIAADVLRFASSWGPTSTRSEQRRANIEALRGLVRVYEETCKTSGTVATVAGFVFWQHRLAEEKLDCKAADDTADAIHVLTYHKAKGLEWPVTICIDLDDEPKSRLWGLQVVNREKSVSFDLQSPLANRMLRYWVWPFGRQSSGIAFADRVENSPAGIAAKKQCEAEELRLLYVGLTRARDLVVLAHDVARETTWLDLAKANWFKFGATDIQLPGGHSMTVVARNLLAQTEMHDAQEVVSEVSWFETRQLREPRLAASVQPSLQLPTPKACIGKIYDFDVRLPIAGRPDEATLGDALHAIFAAELLNPLHPERETMALQILRQHGLESHLNASEVLECVDRFRNHCTRLFPDGVFRVEVPFSVWNAELQNITGYIDLVIETPAGVIVVDHKSFQGQKIGWAAKALSYSGQLRCYKEALTIAEKSVIRTMIHFPVSGGLIDVVV